MEKEGYKETLDMIQKMFPGRIALSVKEVATVMNKNQGTIYDATKRTKNPLPCKKVGGSITINIAKLARWMC